MRLAEARAKARAAMHHLDSGQDPAARKEEARAAACERAAHTVEAVIGEFIKRHLETQHRAPRYVAETRRLFDLHVLPRWRGRTLAEISKLDVIELLDEIVDRGTPIAANRTRAAISAMCNFAVRRSIIEHSPAALIERPGAETKRERALTPAETQAVWAAAGALAYPFGPYFRMVMVTAQRRDEVARIRWADLDLEEKIWMIPSEKTKAGRAHVVPLASLAIDILGHCLTKGEHVFTTRHQRRTSKSSIEPLRSNDAPISGYSKAKVMLDAQIAAGEIAVAPWTIHDLRRTAATQMAKLGVARFTLARVLNHADNTVTAIYDRHEYLAEKRHALDLWAQYLENLTAPPGTNIVPLRAQG